jgi:putative thiamine transport system ATP-binding protein
MLELDEVCIDGPTGRIAGPLSARVGAGELLVLMGPSGSGKSSLLAYLCGALPDGLRGRGRVRVDGQAVEGLPGHRRRIAILFQDDLLFPHLNVIENLLFALPPGRQDGRVAAAQAALAEAGLAGYGARRVHTLSGGQRARVSVLRALLAQPRVLLLDEPFSKLDAALRTRFREFVFARLKALAVPAVLVTHDEADAPPQAMRTQLARSGQDA